MKIPNMKLMIDDTKVIKDIEDIDRYSMYPSVLLPGTCVIRKSKSMTRKDRRIFRRTARKYMVSEVTEVRVISRSGSVIQFTENGNTHLLSDGKIVTTIPKY